MYLSTTGVWADVGRQFGDEFGFRTVSHLAGVGVFLPELLSEITELLGEMNANLATVISHDRDR